MRCERPKPFRLTTTPVHHCLCWCAGLTHYLRSPIILVAADLDLEDAEAIWLGLEPSRGYNLADWRGRSLPLMAAKAVFYRHGTSPNHQTRIPHCDAFRRPNASTTT